MVLRNQINFIKNHNIFLGLPKGGIDELTRTLNRCNIKSNVMQTIKNEETDDTSDEHCLPVKRCDMCGLIYRSGNLLAKHVIKKHLKKLN